MNEQITANGQSFKEISNASNSEVVKTESIDVRKNSRFYVCIASKFEQIFAGAVETIKIHVCQLNEFALLYKLIAWAQ